jgi:hypothetical protein
LTAVRPRFLRVEPKRLIRNLGFFPAQRAFLEPPPFRGLEQTSGHESTERQPTKHSALPDQPAGPAPSAARLPLLDPPLPAASRVFFSFLRAEMVSGARVSGKRVDDPGTVLLPRRPPSVGGFLVLGASGGDMRLPGRPNSCGPPAVARQLLNFLQFPSSSPKVASGGHRATSSSPPSCPSFPAGGVFIRRPGSLPGEGRTAPPGPAAPFRPRSPPPVPGPLLAPPTPGGCLPSAPLDSGPPNLNAACRLPP